MLRVHKFYFCQAQIMSQVAAESVMRCLIWLHRADDHQVVGLANLSLLVFALHRRSAEHVGTKPQLSGCLMD